VGHAVPHDRVAQSLDDVLLSNDFIPFLWTPFSVEGLAHEEFQYSVISFQ
jgi:hypothetical protein